MKSSVEALCLAPSFSCQHIFESCTQTNNENHCLSVCLSQSGILLRSN